MKKKILRITTVPISLKTLLRGQLNFINENEKFEVIGISSRGKELKEVSEQEKIRCYSLDMTRRINPISDILAIFSLYFLLRRLKPHIVHTHTPKAGLIGMMAAFLAKTPHRFHTVAGIPLMEKSGLLKYILIQMEKLTYLLSNIILPNSFGLRNYILENNYTKESKIKVLGFGSSNGINLDYFQESVSISVQVRILKESLSIDSSDLVFLYVGRLVSQKGINELLQAFKEIQRDFTNVKLILVGDFEKDLDPINKDAMDLIGSKHVIHVGYQEDVRPYYSMSDVFVFPSYREGFPNVVLQAGAFNLPCIVTDINGCNEIISNDVNGLIIPKKNQEALYEAMKKFLMDPHLKQKLGRESRMMIKEKYDQSILWKELLKLYEDTI